MDLLVEIQEEIARYRSLQKANDHVKSLKYEIDQAYAELHALEKKLDKEYRDYEKLEGKSVKGLFYNILGSKEKQLEKERQEYLQLSLKFDERKESIKLKEFELEVLEKKVGQFKSSEQRLNKLKKQREAYLLRTPSLDGKRLRGIISDMDSLTRFMTDIKEAQSVGEQLMGDLNKMISLLRKARNWGRWDMHGGKRGRMYKYQKHTNIDRAKQIAYRIQNIISSFDREVRDVYPDHRGISIKFDLDRFNGFTDLFFDNLISDWIVQQKIVNSLNNVKAILDRVTRILQSLDVEADQAHKDFDALSIEKDQLITGE